MNEIRDIRHKIALNQREFAKKIGVRQETVSRWETSTVAPSQRHLSKARTLLAQHRGEIPKDVEREAKAGPLSLSPSGEIEARRDRATKKRPLP